MLHDYMIKLVGRLTNQTMRRLPPLYPQSSHGRDFDMVPGLQYTQTLIVRVIEPILAETLKQIDQELVSQLDGEELDVTAWIEQQFRPALSHLTSSLQIPDDLIRRGSFLPSLYQIWHSPAH